MTQFSSLSVPVAHYQPGVLLHEWKALMDQGLHASRGHEPAQAQMLYRHALAFAQQLLAGPAGQVTDDDRVAAFVVTSLNLAESLVDMEQMAEAVLCLSGAHRTLMALLRNETTSMSLQQAICRHGRETHAALVRHWSEHGVHPEIMVALRDGCMPFPTSSSLLH